jgi:hypothetical protein
MRSLCWARLAHRDCWACDSLISLMSDCGGHQVGPYVTKRCGEDYEGPDFIMGLLHTSLSDFLGERRHPFLR